jgi:hypothetical protein
MDSIDPRLMRWFGELMIIYSSNIELWKELIGSENKVRNWDEIMKEFLKIHSGPVPFSSVEEMHRQWLALNDAVPKRDYDALHMRLETVEEECEKLRDTLHELTTAMGDLENLPKKMAPWLELAQNAMQSHMEWLGELGKNWQSINKPKESLENSNKEA